MFHDHSLMHVSLARDGQISRRRLLQWSAAGIAGSALAGAELVRGVSAFAADLKKQGKACILAWLAGAPSQLDTFDPKPGTPNGGDTKSIKTAVSGVEIAEHFPALAALMNDIALLRSISGKEAAHERGSYHLRTGHRLIGATKFPHFGSLVANQLGDPKSDIPNFVSVGETLSSGFLGVQVAPFVVNRPGQLPDNVARLGTPQQLDRRLALLKDQDADFAAAGATKLASDHQALYKRAADLMKSPRLKAFELKDESDSVKDAYGGPKSNFGQGLLVARRLIETGVPFVEVTRGGWDMHERLYERLPNAAAEVDKGLSQLLKDLKQRGMLDNTLVICMGEFGRTPKINERTPTPGRDHWARNFSALIAGGGIRGGQVVGKTSADGTEIVDRPIAVEDLFQTYCRVLGIDGSKDLITPEGRPVKIVDGGEAIKELLVDSKLARS